MDDSQRVVGDLSLNRCRAAGGVDAVEAREAARVSQISFLREQIDALPEASVQEKQILENQLFDSEKELEAIQRINR